MDAGRDGNGTGLLGAPDAPCREGRGTEAPGRAERAAPGRPGGQRLREGQSALFGASPGAGPPGWLIEYREGKR